ncbi:MAG: 2-phosphosulfolactate phosphatase [Cyclobacteriaceae bacterium]
MKNRSVEVCLSPEMLSLYPIGEKIVVIVDVFRATSTIAAALAHGINRIKPVADLDGCRSLKQEGYIIAGERGGEKVADFDLGNSPFEFMVEQLKGAKIALTTTNGTYALEKAKDAWQIVAGAFLNLGAIAAYLKSQDRDVLVLCAGWKGKFNLEDSLFAGALVARLLPDFVVEGDSSLAVKLLYQEMMVDLSGQLDQASHAKRLNSLKHREDVKYCLQMDQYDVVPILQDDHLVALK